MRVKKCQHNQIGVYVVIHKYIVHPWHDSGEVIDGQTLWRRKVVEKIKCPHCKGLFLRGFTEVEFFNE
jgi:hypothetical protein